MPLPVKPWPSVGMYTPGARSGTIELGSFGSAIGVVRSDATRSARSRSPAVGGLALSDDPPSKTARAWLKAFVGGGILGTPRSNPDWKFGATRTPSTTSELPSIGGGTLLAPYL